MQLKHDNSYGALFARLHPVNETTFLPIGNVQIYSTINYQKGVHIIITEIIT